MADNVHVIERPEDYLSPGELALLAEEAEPHCPTLAPARRSNDRLRLLAR